ncbi:MAG TPA: SGNH/GDSL hydrolase family protein [bacterium]|nr:SGNH/GDSL hydrolase family protein [bacterium]
MPALKNFLTKLRAGQKTTLVALGDSITELTWHTRGHLNWVGLLQEALFETYGRNCCLVINAGRCGEKVQDSLKRVQQDVCRFSPDLVFISYGQNDAVGGQDYLPVFRRSLRALIQQLRASTTAELILQTPNPVVEQTGREKKGTHNAIYAREIVRLGRQQNCLVIDHYRHWKKIEKLSESLKENPNRLWLLMSDSVHPGPLGHLTFFRRLAPYFQVPAFFPWEQ